MAQLPCIGLSWPPTKPPFGSCAIYFHYGVTPKVAMIFCCKRFLSISVGRHDEFGERSHLFDEKQTKKRYSTCNVLIVQDIQLLVDVKMCCTGFPNWRFYIYIMYSKYSKIISISINYLYLYMYIFFFH